MLGLDRARYLLTGAAPINTQTVRYFQQLDMPILELYGMSENCGSCTMSMPNSYQSKSCGRPVPACNLTLDKKDDEGNGEVCVGCFSFGLACFFCLDC